MDKSLNYKNVCLVPKKSIVHSRDYCDTSVLFANKKWKLPVLASNMKSTIDFILAEWMSNHDYFYILHRFYPYNEIFDWIKNNQNLYVSISIGVKYIDKEFLKKLVEEKIKVDCITIDIAHGFSVSMENMMSYINKLYNSSDIKKPFIIAGNIFGDVDSIKFMEYIKVDAIKVGLAFGKACTTYNQTGFASPMFSCGLDASITTDLPLIGDGGISEDGDIVKGLVAGYDMIMCGSLFAACKNSPTILTDTGHKLYYGSASKLNKTDKSNRFIEGRAVELNCNNLSYEEKLTSIEDSLKSAISYAGGYNLNAFNSIKYVVC